MAELTRSQKALNNTTSGFINEFITLICGLILPRLILSHFGSAYNGVTASISQFLSVIVLMKAGIGGVTRAALYKPLAEKDNRTISEIVVQTQRFMGKVALIFLGFTVVFAIIYPIWICADFSWWFSFSLILIISLSTFAQYYFGLTYQMLLNADQRQSVVFLITGITTLLSTGIAAALIYLGGGIHIVKLGSSVVFALSPIVLYFYTRKRYQIDTTVAPTQDLIKQRWDAVGHEVANFVNNNTDIIVLTVFSGILEVSVYTVYQNVILSIRKILANFVTGFGAAFGNMYARAEHDLMRQNLKIFELIVFSLTTFFYSLTLSMIVPFVRIYTSGVTDVNYIRPLFSIIITLAGAFSCFRIPYQSVVTAAGHYKQTRNGAFTEAIINIVLSIAFVIKFGLVGVAIGTLAAAIFRTCQYALYLNKQLLPGGMKSFWLHLFISLSIIGFTYVFSTWIVGGSTSIPRWILNACICGLVCAVLTLGTNFLFFRKDSIMLYQKIQEIILAKRKRKKIETV